jgi:hypothetical protein
VVVAAVVPAAREADLPVLRAPRQTHRRLPHQRTPPVLPAPRVERAAEALDAGVALAQARDQPRLAHLPTRLRRPPPLAACLARCA